jgi:hypothetical protein
MVEVAPLERYHFSATYRLAQTTESSPQLIWRVTQFDANGQPLKTDEGAASPSVQAQAQTGTVAHIFVTDERTAKVEVGLGLFGRQATEVTVEGMALRLAPTWPALSAVLVLVGLGGYLAWPHRRRVLINAGLALTSLLLTLLAVELLARLIPFNQLVSPNWPSGYHIPYRNGQSYRLAKNFPRTVVTDDQGDRHLVMSNSLGVRDVEAPPDKDLILVLGDSMTFGWAISDLNDTWPRRLNEELPANYHVINAGVSGYNTFQEVLLFETLLEDMGRKPRVVLLSFFSGIWERNYSGPAGRFAVMNDVMMYVLARERLLHLASSLVEQGPVDDLKRIGASHLDAAHQLLLKHSRLYFTLSLLLLLRLEEQWEVPLPADPVAPNRDALWAFKTAAEAHGVLPVVAYLPADNLFTPTKWEKQTVLVAQLTKLCDELELPFLNPYANMQALGITGDNATARLTLVYNRHYSPAGNALYAKALGPLLADYLEQNLIKEVGYLTNEPDP